MDYALKSQRVKTSKEIFDTVTEQQVDLDFTLPDYCADIEKILKCFMDVRIYNRNLSGGILTAEGASIVRVLYCDSNKSALRICEQTVPFSASFPLSDVSPEFVVFADAKPEYINCRALTPRRITIHGAFSLHLRVDSSCSRDLFCEGVSDNLQLLTKEISLWEVSEFCQTQFSLCETVPMGVKTNVESIVRSDAVATVVDFTHQGDKLILKGELTLRMLYICDSKTGESDRYVYVMPFTQILDKSDSGMEVTDISLSVMTYDLKLKAEAVTGETSVSVDAKMCASLIGYKNTQSSYVSDAYSTCDETLCEYGQASVCTEVHPLLFQTMAKSTISLGDEKISRIVDIFCESASVSPKLKEDEVEFFSKANICILAYTEDGELVCMDRAVDINASKPVDKHFNTLKCPKVCISSMSYRIGDSNDMELRTEVRFSAVLKNEVKLSQVTSINILEESCASKSCPVTLYYAKEGERVWDIAKSFKADVGTLTADNLLSEEIIDSPEMLVVCR